MSDYLVATESGSFVDMILDQACYHPNTKTNGLSTKEFKSAIVECYKRLGVSRISKTNKALGKGVSCTIEILDRTPAPNGGLALAA